MSGDENTLMRAVLEQMTESDFKLDFEKIAAATGAPTVNAARVRWSRFKDKLSGKNGAAPAPGSATTPSKPTGAVKRTPAKTGSARKPSAKKRKQDEIEGVDGEDVDEPVTPSKPARKRAVKKVKKSAAEEADNMLLGGSVQEPKADTPDTFAGNPYAEAASGGYVDEENRFI